LLTKILLPYQKTFRKSSNDIGIRAAPARYEERKSRYQIASDLGCQFGTLDKTETIHVTTITRALNALKSRSNSKDRVNMIRVILQGGLGNILFQYAVGRRLALKHQTSLKLNVVWYCPQSGFYRIQGLRQIRYFDITARFYLPVLRCAMRMGLGHGLALDSPPNYCENHFGFDPKVLEQPDGVCLNGYFQSEKYFKA